MSERQIIEIDPDEKIDEILELFKAYNPKVFVKTDTDYAWLQYDDAACIVFPNPHGGEPLKIIVGCIDNFTLSFATGHYHYEYIQDDYESMLQKVRAILDNAVCSARLIDSTGKWYGDSFIHKEEMKNSPQEVFDFVFKIKEFYNRLLRTGYTTTYVFWNPVYNQVKTFAKTL